MNNPELVASLLKQGGKVLIVGGEVKDLPQEYHEHPQVLIWDDNKQGFNQKDVPSNVKVIIYSRWVSHATAKQLSNAAKNLHAIRFPMLRPREIKALMSEVVVTEPIKASAEQLEVEINSHTIVETDMPQPKSVKEFIAKYMNINIDYKVKGTVAAESRRLSEIAKKEEFKTTTGSIAQAMYLLLRDMGKSKKPAIVKPVKPSKKLVEGDDFDELYKLLDDAISAMKLIQEHMPKVRMETEKLRNMRKKAIAFFSE
jgi:hypothetical protein